MGYRLGVDLGTTYTAAAVLHDRPEIVGLGNRTAEVPSVVFLHEDGTFLVGEPAERRGAVAPQRLAREFKRRIGDDKPYLLAGTPFAAHVLTAKLLRWVVDRVAEREGGSPDHIVVTHPANWGPHKREVLQHAASLADLSDVGLATEPECAALRYASMRTMEPGSVVAVYDLGGGTFDTTVLTRTAAGFEVRGAPAGIELLGGVDFDEAILNHVLTGLGVDPDELDLDDPPTRIGHARLRRECVVAKEALSQDTEIFVPVGLPGLQTDVRVTRGEFEDLIRPAVGETVAALRRALRGAKVEPADLSAVLLAGGSSRIPLVTEMLSAELGRPVAIDAHPKHLVAMGAALLSARATVPDQPSSPTQPGSGLGRWAGSTRLTPRRRTVGVETAPRPPGGPPGRRPVPTTEPTEPPPQTAPSLPKGRGDAGVQPEPGVGSRRVAASDPPPPPPPPSPWPRRIVVAAAVAAVAAVAAIALRTVLGGDDDTVTGDGCPAPKVVPAAAEVDNGRLSLVHRRDAGVDTWVSRQDGSQVVHETRHADSCYPYAEGRWYEGDVNADARPDVVQVRDGRLTTWLGRPPSSFDTVDFSGEDPDYPFLDGQWNFLEVDGDDRMDLLHVTSDGATTWSSRGDGTWSVGERVTVPDYPYVGGQYVDSTDEGAGALFHITGRGVHAWRAGPDGQPAPTLLPSLSPDYDTEQGSWHSGDLNGDDLPDLVHVRADGVTTWQTQPNGSYAVHDDTGKFGATYGYLSGTWRTGDVTGDGQDELLHLFGGGVNTWRYTGAGDYRFFGPTFRFPPPNHIDDTVHWEVREVTGDDKDDLLLVWHEGVDNFVSEGGGRFRRVTKQLETPSGADGAAYPYQEGDWY